MLAVAVKRYHWFPSGVEAPMAMATCYHSPGSLSFPLRRGCSSASPTGTGLSSASLLLFHPLSLARFSAASR